MPEKAEQRPDGGFYNLIFSQFVIALKKQKLTDFSQLLLMLLRY